MACDTGSDHIIDMNIFLMSRPKSSNLPAATTAIATSLSEIWLRKPSFFDGLGDAKLAPSVRVGSTEAHVSIPSRPVSPQRFLMQGYGRSRVNEKRFEVEELVDNPVEHDCGQLC